MFQEDLEKKAQRAWTIVNLAFFLLFCLLGLLTRAEKKDPPPTFTLYCRFFRLQDFFRVLDAKTKSKTFCLTTDGLSRAQGLGEKKKEARAGKKSGTAAQA